MKDSTLVFEGQVTVERLRATIAAEREIAVAVRQLGYNPDKQRLVIEAIADDRYSVYFGGKSYVGIWDGRRKTFVD